MSEKRKPTLTATQKRVVNHNQGDILVSASAGSGKTHVMISRIVRLILEKKTTVDRILATTYTEAAALEMKEKLKKALIEQAGKTGDVYIAKQIPQVDTADVGTIHSFCSKLLRAYFYHLGISPDYQILSDEDKAEMTDLAMRKTFNDYYKDERFIKLVDREGTRRSDNSLREKVLKAYAFFAEEVDFDYLLDKSIELYNEDNYIALFESTKKEIIDLIKPKLIEAETLIGYATSTNKPKLATAIINLKTLLTGIVTTGNIFELSTIGTYKLGNRGEKSDPEFRSSVAKFLKETAELLSGYCPPESSYQEFLNERASLKEHTEIFVEVVKAFRDNYAKIKKEENLLDFSDLQSFTLNLLQDESIRKSVSEKYDFIFVDEYQDVNAIQENIMTLLGRDNVFTVGDDKQSIYAFRGCRSEFFTEKKKRLKEEGKTTEKLNDNFRSARAIIDSANKVFSYCMTEETYGLNYQKDASLVYGGLFPEDQQGRFSVSAITSQGRAQQSDVEDPRIYNVLNEYNKESQTEEEKAIVSEVVNIIEKELQSTYYNVKEDKVLPVTYKDIVILVSKSSTKVKALIKGLVKRGIPITTSAEENVLEYPEIIMLVNVLKGIDCMKQDIPLATTLLSPVGNFTDEDLFKISSFAKKNREEKLEYFYQAYEYCLEKLDDELGERLKNFHKKFTSFRALSDFLSAGETVEKLVNDCDYVAHFYADAYGNEKVERITAFLNYVYTAGADITLHELIKKLSLTEVMEECSSSKNAVQIMTMHKSKGLEFPVVINFALDNPFSTKDETGTIIFDRTFGLVTKFFLDKERTHKETLVRKMVLRNKGKEKLKEQMRLLYVAMTRATYSMHLVFNVKEDGEVKPNSFLYFLPPDMLEASTLPQTNGLSNQTAPIRKVVVGKAEESDVNALTKSLTFDYPYKADVDLPLKSSVTKATKKAHEEEYYPVQEIFKDSSQKAEDGVTAHKILECFDFFGNESIKECAERLIADKVLEKESVQKINLDKIQNAINLEFIESLKDKTLYREKAFLMNMPAKMLFGTETDSEVLVQGIIDLLAIDEKTATIIDYKYSSKNREELEKTYSPQLNLYAYAVEKILGLTVTEKKVVSLLTGEVVPIK